MDYFVELKEALDSYLEPDQVATCYQAYLVAHKAHEGQMRRSGEPYISHPVAAALISAGIGRERLLRSHSGLTIHVEWLGDKKAATTTSL